MLASGLNTIIARTHVSKRAISGHLEPVLMSTCRCSSSSPDSSGSSGSLFPPRVLANATTWPFLVKVKERLLGSAWMSKADFPCFMSEYSSGIVPGSSVPTEAPIPSFTSRRKPWLPAEPTPACTKSSAMPCRFTRTRDGKEEHGAPLVSGSLSLVMASSAPFFSCSSKDNQLNMAPCTFRLSSSDALCTKLQVANGARPSRPPAVTSILAHELWSGAHFTVAKTGGPSGRLGMWNLSAAFVPASVWCVSGMAKLTPVSESIGPFSADGFAAAVVCSAIGGSELPRLVIATFRCGVARGLRMNHLVSLHLLVSKNKLHPTDTTTMMIIAASTKPLHHTSLAFTSLMALSNQFESALVVASPGRMPPTAFGMSSDTFEESSEIESDIWKNDKPWTPPIFSCFDSR
mmetsp:Transcript_43926/g.82523  ORF Transcript_43926/g.82523 Transcript_43926/m.82523 type:complete len:404 (+) Transcript_43926:232-1443(+)